MLLFGLLALVLALWALNVISKVDPKVGARVLKASGGLLSLGFAVFLGLRDDKGPKECLLEEAAPTKAGH